MCLSTSRHLSPILSSPEHKFFIFVWEKQIRSLRLYPNMMVVKLAKLKNDVDRIFENEWITDILKKLNIKSINIQH